ncbi:MAG: aminotransferase class IV [Tepidisphaeraceae bacterium]
MDQRSTGRRRSGRRVGARRRVPARGRRVHDHARRCPAHLPARSTSCAPARSCAALSFDIGIDDSVIADAIDDLLELNELTDARLRFTVTRGAIDTESGQTVPTLLLTATKLEPYPAALYERGMTASVIDRYRANPLDIQAGHKTLDYLSRFAALRNAQQRGASEALWFNVSNHLQSGSISNVFLVKAGKLLTPPTNDDLANDTIRTRTPYPRSNALPGITRGAVLDAAKAESIEAVVGPLTLDDLLNADEVFVTNSIMRVMPVVRIERRPVGDEKPGPITRRLSLAVDALARN